METLLLFVNVSQPPYCNNLFPPVRAFQRAFRTVVIEPQGYADFVPTGGAKPALIPEDAVNDHTDPPPDVIVCLGGALHFSKRALRSFSRLTALAGFALSDPYGLAASLQIGVGWWRIELHAPGRHHHDRAWGGTEADRLRTGAARRHNGEAHGIGRDPQGRVAAL